VLVVTKRDCSGSTRHDGKKEQESQSQSRLEAMPQLVAADLTEEEFHTMKDAEVGERDMIQNAVTNTNPVTIAFKDLSYSIEVNEKRRLCVGCILQYTL
jgi:hypothetical protein